MRLVVRLAKQLGIDLQGKKDADLEVEIEAAIKVLILEGVAQAGASPEGEHKM